MKKKKLYPNFRSIYGTDCIKIVFQREYDGYLYRRELIKIDKEPAVEVVACYDMEHGIYLGGAHMAHMLCSKYGIKKFELRTDNSKVASVGFSERDQKWYGWSHRAIHGFGIGARCEKGDCAYRPDNFKELQEDCGGNYNGVCSIKQTVQVQDTPGFNYLIVLPDDEEEQEPLCCLENCVYALGRGEWTAENLEDAHQMAIDFAANVS